MRAKEAGDKGRPEPSGFQRVGKGGWMEDMGDLLKSMGALRDALEGVDGEVTLGLEAVRGEDGQWTWRLASGPATHTVRWALGRGLGRAGEKEGLEGLALRRDDEGEKDGAEVLGDLDAVFGPPGFDSGARATVFKEISADLGERGLGRVLDSLQRGQPSDDADLERACHGLARLLERGPSGARDGAQILGRVLRHHGLERVLEQVGARWRFGT